MLLKDLKKNSLKLYKSWRKTGVYCPAFQENVHFTLKGWNHIVGNSVGQNKPHRSLGDIYRRLRLLPLARDIISKAGTIQAVRTVKGTTSYALDSIETVNINGSEFVTKVRVVVIDTKTGKKFFSIMDRKIK